MMAVPSLYTNTHRSVIHQNAAPQREIRYECPDCEHITINPEPDDEGDRICEECGCILPEKYHCNCDSCGYENIDPEPNEDGAYLCENCGEEIEVEVCACFFLLEV